MKISTRWDRTNKPNPLNNAITITAEQTISQHHRQRNVPTNGHFVESDSLLATTTPVLVAWLERGQKFSGCYGNTSPALAAMFGEAVVVAWCLSCRHSGSRRRQQHAQYPSRVLECSAAHEANTMHGRPTNEPATLPSMPPRKHTITITKPTSPAGRPPQTRRRDNDEEIRCFNGWRQSPRTGRTRDYFVSPIYTAGDPTSFNSVPD